MRRISCQDAGQVRLHFPLEHRANGKGARLTALGRTLIKPCFEHARRHGGRLAWCTARESARGFYEALGFTSSPLPFTLPARGDLLFYEMHYVLPGKPICDVEQTGQRMEQGNRHD